MKHLNQELAVPIVVPTPNPFDYWVTNLLAALCLCFVQAVLAAC